MLIQKRLTAGKKTALAATMLILIIIISYLVYTNFLAEKIEIIKPLKVEVEILALPKINPIMMEDFLSKSPYRDLESAAVGSVEAGNKGRQNPFRVIPFYFREPALEL